MMNQSIKSFLSDSWKKGSNIDNFTVFFAVSIGAVAHSSFYFIFKYCFDLYESLVVRSVAVILSSFLAILYFRRDLIRPIFLQAYWHLMLIWILPLTFTFNLLANNFHELWLYWEIFMVFVLILYVSHWLMVLVDLFCGLIGAYLFYKLEFGSDQLVINVHDLTLYLIVIVFSLITGLFFSFATRIALSKALKKQYKELMAISGSIAHELRNPLGTISIIDSQIRDGLSGDLMQSDKIKLIELTNSIDGATRSANNIINIILSDLSEKPVDDAEFVYLKPQNVIPHILQNYGYKTNEEKNRVRFVVDDKVDFVFRAVSERFTFIVYNLLKNALYYVREYPNSEVVVGTETRTIKDKEWNVIYVHDTGPGIAPDVISKLFGDFFTSGKKDGTGLGLAFCKRNMQIFGGDIICESELGKWTKFSLLFPKVDQVDAKQVSQNLNNEENQKRKSKAIVGVGSNVDKVKILVVDDEKTNLLVTKSIIEKNLNVLCELAHDGKEAAEIEMHHVEDHKLVLTDIQMPEMNGVAAAKNIRSFNKTIPIIALTSLEYEELQKADHNYFNEHLNKPMLCHMLCRSISKFIPNLEDNMEYLGEADQYLPDLKSKKALIADDQELNLMVLSKKLENLGMQVTKAMDGKQLVEIYQNSLIENSPSVDGKQSKKSQFDIIITDINMPAMSGIDAVKKIREIELISNITYKNRTPIIALSGDGRIEDIMSFLNAGMNDYFIKGSDINKLIKTIVIYLNPNKNYKSLHHKKEGEVLRNNLKNDINPNENGAKILNQEKISQFADCDRREFLKIFLEGSCNQLSHIKRALDKKDNDELSIALHALKGISGNIGAEKLFNIAVRVEYNLKHQIALGDKWYEELLDSYEELKSEILLKELNGKS